MKICLWFDGEELRGKHFEDVYSIIFIVIELLSYALAFNFTHSRRVLRACEERCLHI